MQPSSRSALIIGTIAYRGAGGAQTGVERFELVDHAGGQILRAFCEMDDIALLRDVSISMDRAGRPVEGYCRVLSGGRLSAASWFTIDAREVRAESLIAGQGVVSQRLPLAGPLAYLGLHPLQGDALLAQVRDTDAPGIFRTIDAVTNSISPNGDENMGAIPVAIDVAFIGHETVTVTAGTFAARRYAVRWKPDWPAADLWVRTQDSLFVLMRWSMIDNWFELVSFEERTASQEPS